MKTYLVSGIFTFSDGQTRPFASTHTLGPSGCMDFQTLTYVEALALEHQNRNGTIAQLAQAHSFQQLETAPPVPPAEVHLNDCSVVMPPVDSPLLIEIAPGVLVRAQRPVHAASRDDHLRFEVLDNNGWVTGEFIGRPRWTHQ